MSRASWFRRASNWGVTAIMAAFGFTGIASAQTITNTGTNSRNSITTTTTDNCSVVNNNHVSVANTNHQSAVSGDATSSGNTTAASWSGWAALDPQTAQAQGISYASWWSGVVQWIATRAGGNGWNSSQSNLSWTPAGTTWSAYDPLTWQTNGQSFGNWYNSVEAYLNANNAAWVLGWPADATGMMSSGATSGSAVNTNSANFSININNAARAAAGTNACGQSNFVPPTCTSCGEGGHGGGPAPAITTPAYTPHATGGGGGSGGGGGYVGSSYHPVYHASKPTAPAVVQSTAPSAPSQPPVTPSTPSTPPPAPTNTISNTGTDSTNTISSTSTNNSRVVNNNSVNVVNFSTQTATSGNATTAGNTTTGSGSSGTAANSNGTGADIGLSN